MNSEELGQSLRTEFESYLNETLAQMKQEFSQLQQKIDGEIEKHKSHLDGMFREFSARVQTDVKLDEGFEESVVEHLRLARDEGARITATAISEAEELTKAEKREKKAESLTGLSDIRDAINDISSQNSQGAILKALIDHASMFVPRGAFFVVKNQNFAGWRVFGNQENLRDGEITKIVFPTSASTILGESIRSLSAVESTYGTYSEDAEYLSRLEFGKPEKMFAVPLIARGRGVAAIYADLGDGDEQVNVEALETLVSVAGLTVELLAAAQNSNYVREPVKATSYKAETTMDRAQSDSEKQEKHSAVQNHPKQVSEEADNFKAEKPKTNTEEIYSYDQKPEEPEEPEKSFDMAELDTQKFAATKPAQPDVVETGAVSSIFEKHEYAKTDQEKSESQIKTEEAKNFLDEKTPENVSVQGGYPVYDEAIEEVPARAQEAVESDPVLYSQTDLAKKAEAEAKEILAGYPVETDSQMRDFSKPSSVDYSGFETNQDFNSSPVQFQEQIETNGSVNSTYSQSEPEESLDQESEEISYSDNQISEVAENGATSENVAAVSSKTDAKSAYTASVRTRFSERNVDLPIEVNEEERRLHNDARRFARLLVSEIKLYNEQKVREGRDSNDLYDRLREAIDRSREMYDKRVQSVVVDRFDYFHYEIVNTLAEGREAQLGTSYPGATV